MSNATPRPWAWDGNGDVYAPDKGPLTICPCRYTDDAELIVRAVNSYDALVDALTECANVLREQFESDPAQDHSGGDFYVDLADKALSLAEGRTA